jgi:primosomal replication protein N
MRIEENNKVRIAGEICGQFEFSHDVYGEKFYLGEVRVERASGVPDYVPIMVSDRMVDVECKWNNVFVEIEGQLRSYNKSEETRKRLLLSVFVQEFTQLESVSYHENYIELDGFICKTPVHRTTPLGREVSDLLVAVNRAYGRSDYIPCISWGRNASFVSNLDIGTRVRLEGRIQSREYRKRISETHTEIRTAYEVSVNKLEVVQDEE